MQPHLPQPSLRLALPRVPFLCIAALTLALTLLASCTPVYVVRREYFAYRNTPQYQQQPQQNQPQSQWQDSTQQWQNPMVAPAPQTAYVPIITPWYDDLAVSFYAGPSFNVGVGFGWTGWNHWNNWGWHRWNTWNNWNRWNNVAFGSWGNGWGGWNSFGFDPWCGSVWGGGWAGGWNGWARPWNGWNNPYQQRWDNWQWNRWNAGWQGSNIVNNYNNAGQQPQRRDFGVQRPYNYTNNPQPVQPNVPNQSPNQAATFGGAANGAQPNAGYPNYPSYNGVGGRVRSANSNAPTQTPQPAPQQYSRPSYAQPSYSQPSWGGTGSKGGSFNSAPSYNTPSYNAPSYRAPSNSNDGSYGGGSYKGGSFNSGGGGYNGGGGGYSGSSSSGGRIR